MSIRKITSIALLSVVSLATIAQTSDNSSGFSSKLPSIAIGAGVLHFNGDIGKGAGVTPYSTIRPGFNFTIEERPLPYLGISLMGLMGRLAASERSLDTTRNLNFESKIITGDLLINFHFAGSIFKRDYPVDPFIYAGASFLSFSPYADLKDANGNPYYYWTDGTVRNMPETSTDLLSAKVVHRDYTYETSLDSGKYSKHTFSIPIGVGIKLRITDNFFVNLQTTYYFTFSQNIDNYKLTGKNNKYIYSFFTIEYQFGKHKEDMGDMKYKDVDFSALIKDTVKTTKVKEVKQPTMSDSAIAAQYAKDTLSEDRGGVAFNENPTLEALAKEDKAIAAKNKNNTGPSKIPARFQAADKNGDGVISSQEITQAIDDFFDGTSTMTIADINGLIDYFFDQ
jgi:hypothetical protein